VLWTHLHFLVSLLASPTEELQTNDSNPGQRACPAFLECPHFLPFFAGLRQPTTGPLLFQLALQV